MEALNPEELGSLFERYRQNLALAFRQLEGSLSASGEVASVVDLARLYLKDAEHFKERGELLRGIVALSYGEGLLDALRMLKLVNFDWGREEA